MNHVFPFVGLLLLAAILMLYIANFSWQKRTVVGAKPLALLALCGFFWTFGYAFEILGISLSWMLFWDNVKFLGVYFSSTTILIFALEYAGYRKWVRRRVLFSLLAVPTFFYLLILSNPWHQWMYVGDPQLEQTFLPALSYAYTSFGWATIGYAFLEVFLGSAILIHQYFRASKVYRRQILILLIGAAIPFLGIVLKFSNFFAFSWTSIVPFLVVISGMILFVGLFRYGLLDLLPITHTAVLESIQDGVIVLDLSDRVLDMNPAAITLLDLSGKKTIGKPLRQTSPIWASIADECRQQECVTIEILPDGERQIRYLEFHCQQIEKSKGRSQGLLLVIHDTTGHVLTEKVMAERAASLADAVAAEKAESHVVQARSDIVLRNVQDGIAMAGLDEMINFVNPAFLQLTGYEEDELLGKDPVDLLSEDVPELVWRAMRRAVREERPWQGEVQFQRKDGRFYMAEVLFAPVRDENGRMVGYVSSHRDISKQKDLEKARSQFINNISHELRTPITNLKLYSELMKLDVSVVKREKYQAILERQIERLEEMIQDILQMSALDLGEVEMAHDEVDVQQLLETAVSHYQEAAAEKQITLTFVPAAPKQFIYGDFDQLERAIGKLLDNALIFTLPMGTVTVTTQRVVESGRDCVHIAIVDDGPGIAADEQERIFDRFYRGHLAESGHVPGTGLGLSTAVQIVRLLGGTIVVDSAKGDGSTFTIRLPALGG